MAHVQNQASMHIVSLIFGRAAVVLLLYRSISQRRTVRYPFSLCHVLALACCAGDAVCEATGLGGNDQVEGAFVRAADLENFWAHWKYNLEDAGCETDDVRHACFFVFFCHNFL